MRPARLTEERMLELMAYADGEGDVASRAQIRASLTTDAEARAFLASLLDLAPFAEEALQPSLEIPDFTAMFSDEALRQLEPEKAPVEAKSLAVVPIDFAAARRQKFGTSGFVAAALAIAAAVALYVQTHPTVTPTPLTPIALATASVAPSAAASVETSALAANGNPAVAQGRDANSAVVEVNRVESDTPVDVFLIPAESTPGTSVVVWLGDDNALGGP